MKSRVNGFQQFFQLSFCFRFQFFLMGNLPCCQKDEGPVNKNKPAQIKPTIQYEKPKTNVETLKQEIKVSSNGEAPKVDQKSFSKHGPQNYQSLKYLGRGTFGDVVLAQDKETSKQYAMKIIDKNKIKEVNLMQCKTIKQISHRDILVTIRQTFQNQNKIYIIMEYLNKGDIYFYLKKKQVKFSEEVIRDLITQIVYGVEVLHGYGIIYRQLKPQNILVTNDGHIKLTDYGLSKMLIENKTFTCTFVGALQYMAPEAIKGNYGKQIDIWSIGILIFELIFQRNPFSSSQYTEIVIQHNIETLSIQDILNENIGKISLDLRDLLICLLQKEPQKRLTIEGIKKHAFFKGINWDDVKERKNNPPLKQYVEKNDHIRFRDPTNDAEVPHRPVKFSAPGAQKHGYEFNLIEFRNSG